MDDGNHDELKSRNLHPQLKSNYLSNIFFCWGLKLFYKGWKKELNEDDLYKPFEEHESHYLGDELEALWKLEKIEHSHPCLLRPIWKLFKKDIILHALWMFILEFVIKLSQPMLIKKLIEFYTPNQTSTTLLEAYIYSVFIVITSFLLVVINHWFQLSLQHLGMKIRIACCSLIYRKSLKLSKKALVKVTIGQMINLLSNDVNRFDNIFRYFHYIWVGPLESIIIMYLIYDVTGYTGLAGFLVLLLFIPFQMVMGKLTTQYRQKTAMKTDERVLLMSEIIFGIQVIKMYTWERSFSRLIEQIRKSEIKQIRLTSYIRALHMSFNKFITRASVFLCIITYTFTGNRLNASYVYVISSFYNILKSAISNDFPQAITQTAEALVSIARIEEFLQFDEVYHDSISEPYKAKKISSGTLLINSAKKNKSVGVYLENASAKWGSSQDENTISNINFNVGPQQLVAIVGAVGSGKTSLLQAIMKELPLSQGTKDVVGKISYASQEPWLFAGTIKQNILFGEPWDAKKYERVIKVCALERDLSILPHGDRSLVGDRGISLSGGQRARINLARAVYKEADIYILDDPLSAVDTHVGKQIFEDCICSYLRGKCTILVTHQLQYLKNVNKIFLLERGRIAISGTYKELSESTVEFAKLLKNHDEDEECDDTIDEESCVMKYFENLTGEDPPENIEKTKIGSTSSVVYTRYLKYAGGWCCGFYVLVLFILTQFAASGSDYFVNVWVNLEQTKYLEEKGNKSLLRAVEDDVLMEQNFDDFFIYSIRYAKPFNPGFLNTNNCIIIYSCIIGAVIVVTILRSITFFKVCMKASIRMHNTMFTKICNGTMLFFNTNSSGRILNRFSKDMGCIDETLPNVLVDTIQIALNVLAVNIVIGTVNPWILISTIVIGLIFYLFKIVYVSSSRNLKRMEATTRSPVFSHIHASLQGITTVRAFQAQEILRTEFDEHQDLHSSAYYLFICCNRTFGFWLDLLCVVYIAVVTFSFFVTQNNYGGNVGLAITQAISLTGMFQWGMRQWSELDNSMMSVERVLEYIEIKQEIHGKQKEPPKKWPEHGMLEFQSVYLRYATNLPYVLNNLTFKIKPKEKVGIVGRTGAGKSTLISALFRLADIEGKILIDGICTSDIPLKSMRSKIAIIPQVPVLFSGTIRSNLDPMDEYEDSDLWRALDDVALKDVVSEMQLGLESKIGEGGSNLSLGQRQLVCLARAILRKNKILVLDEATANVDPNTDALIQSTIRNKFENCTVLTIAHRLHTVMDSDKVLVMDAGSAIEFNHPHILLQNPEGIFYSLVKQTGKSMAEYLCKIAEQHFNNYYTEDLSLTDTSYDDNVSQ
ncbi:probable multidrug resistance-associated protein lethal(2)03659 isoform X1 [Diorhabda carinulata]|uniref:probable multidrug resistance-associated protein lethal(2)03659 isoform X1 n=1 Tax=Diorhabda carinulata TaxID=1163345 RepID=UPI0025A1ADF8|nr:probable multidrug resistance-associated protein lethal(2)03659 isoform X1 [Diorhabda carinulata]